MADEDYVTKQLESQVGLKKNLVLKLEKAKIVYEKALKSKLDRDAADKVEAYNTWRAQEEKRGRAQDDHGKSLVKVMIDRVKAASPREPVTESMCNVLGNSDSKANYTLNIIS